MKLYYADTLMPRLACAVAKHVGAPVEFVAVDLRAGEQRAAGFRALNSNAKVPLLVDGALRLWEADAIACYLAGRFRPELWPEGEVHELIRWMSWNARHFTDAGSRLYFEHVIKPAYLRQAPDPAAVEPALADFAKFAAVLDAHLAGRRFVLGEAPTVADFCLATALPWAHAAHLPLAATPAVESWYDRIEDLPGWRDPYAA
ncbi:MAG: glutathione S-transferase family protein [Caulobacteraceae bacterium]